MPWMSFMFALPEVVGECATSGSKSPRSGVVYTRPKKPWVCATGARDHVGIGGSAHFVRSVSNPMLAMYLAFGRANSATAEPKYLQPTGEVMAAPAHVQSGAS